MRMNEALRVCDRQVMGRFRWSRPDSVGWLMAGCEQAESRKVGLSGLMTHTCGWCSLPSTLSTLSGGRMAVADLQVPG